MCLPFPLPAAATAETEITAWRQSYGYGTRPWEANHRTFHVKKHMVQAAASSETSACPNTLWIFIFTVASSCNSFENESVQVSSLDTPTVIKGFARVPAFRVVMATEIVTWPFCAALVTCEYVTRLPTNQLIGLKEKWSNIKIDKQIKVFVVMSEGSNTLRVVRRVHNTTQCNVTCQNVSFALYMSMHRNKMNISTSHPQRLTFYSIKFVSIYLINSLRQRKHVVSRR